MEPTWETISIKETTRLHLRQDSSMVVAPLSNFRVSPVLINRSDPPQPVSEEVESCWSGFRVEEFLRPSRSSLAHRQSCEGLRLMILVDGPTSSSSPFSCDPSTRNSNAWPSCQPAHRDCDSRLRRVHGGAGKKADRFTKKQSRTARNRCVFPNSVFRPRLPQ